MPIAPDIADSNRTQTERLRRLARELTPEMLCTKLSNGWTVAVALAHIAFWDHQRYCLMRRWAQGRECSGSYDGDLFNEVLQPFLELIPRELTPELAVKNAEAIDQLLEELTDQVVAAALARADAPNLQRGWHREHHLDQIEQALSGRSSSDA